MLKRLLQCLREYKRATILTPIFMVGEVTCECIIPLLTAKLINGIQAGCTMEFITNYGLALLALWASAPCPACSVPRPRRALPGTCGMTFFTMCRTFPLPILTAFQPRRW